MTPTGPYVVIQRDAQQLVDRKTLADQWCRQVRDPLGVKPGQLGGGRSKLTGVADIATLQTLARRDDVAELLGGYGLVVVDECHHVPAAAFESAARTIPAHYWLGLTATPYRRDGLDDLIGFQLGPARHTLEHADPDTLEGALGHVRSWWSTPPVSASTTRSTYPYPARSHASIAPA